MTSGTCLLTVLCFRVIECTACCVGRDLFAAAGFGEFDFQHISTLPPEVLTSPTPMVLLATPGMLHGGLALKALKLWAGGPENLVLLPGYCVRGTVGAMLIDGKLFGHRLSC